MSMDLRAKLMDIRKEEIVRTATLLFYEKGYTNTSMTDIAQQLSVGKPYIYLCFKSKAELLAEVCNTTTAMAAALANEALASQDTPAERLRHVVEQLCLRVMDGRMNMSVLFREIKHLPSAAREELAKNFHSFNHSLKLLLREGVENGEFIEAEEALVTQAISGMATWIFAWYNPRGPFPPEHIAQQIAGYALRMVCRQPSSLD